MAEGTEVPREDDAAVVDRLQKELAEAEAAMERLIAENLQLRQALNKEGRAEQQAAPARTGAKRPKGGYRGADARIALEEAVAKANSAVASMSIDNEILRARVGEQGGKTSMSGCAGIAIAVGVVATGVAMALSPRDFGPMMLLLLTISLGLYALYGWFLVFSLLPRYLRARRVRGQQITPIASAPTNRTIVIRGTVQSRDAAFDAWFPQGVRAVWQSLVVIDTGFRGRSRRVMARRHRQADAFDVADDEGTRVRVEPAGAEVVPEELSALGKTLARVGRRELDAIPGIIGERDDLQIEMELIRHGATVQIEGRLARNPDPVLRSTKKAPLSIVVLAREGVDDATRMVRHGFVVGTVVGSLTIAAVLVVVQHFSR